jgi:GrpB-like predicted nucleotidyltransferase (UPF0157 family)
VDIIVTVHDIEDEASYLPALVEAGYVLRVRETGHRMLRTPKLDVHVHLWPADGPELARHTGFSDWLRVSPEDREAYASLKRELAQRQWADMNYYAEAKGDLIAAMTGRAAARTHRDR